ncbi:hypothetical protein FPOAC2_12862 [Fusarium poae]|uniref:hypothetical protein n=1 Tax=Fusarium poae TaxID=36050 RepID=UPI001CE8D6D7|nr:hypothetical protein FPOAC1_012514 [Fusarium poae]KAG8667679.1 hypothetical protein FPOAC1_012514 [Fusarium poae]
MPPTPVAIREAKPVVRLKNKDGSYKETQEADMFASRGGKPDGLLDDERWLPVTGDHTHIYPYSGPIADTSFNTNGTITRHHRLWNPGPFAAGGSIYTRVLTHPHTTHRLVARACMSERSEVGDIAKKCRKELGMTSFQGITIKSNIRCLYVGISALTCLPVVLCNSPDWDDSSLSTDDVNEFRDLVVDWDTLSGAKDVIWTENMLIPGNIAYLKSALANKLLDQEKQRFLQIMMRENGLLQRQLNPAGVAKTLPSSESAERKPAIRRLMQSGYEYHSLHFELWWPPMAALKFPQEMIDAMNRFLAQHPHDNVPMNIALAATIIYLDLADKGWPSEGFAGGPNVPLDIRPPPLGQFVLYFPHMLRFVEIKHLTEFIHPGRFAAGQYNKDGSTFNGIKIKSNLIDLKRMRLWYSQVRCRYPQVSKSHRFRLIPASMPGTHMVFPSDCIDAEPPSMDLFRMCCLNDVRTLGLPSYHHHVIYNDEDCGVFRHIAGPEWLFSKHLQAPTHSINKYPAATYWRPASATRFMALTGQARRIDAWFLDVSSDYYVDNKPITEFVERYFGNVACYTQDYDYCEHNSEHSRNKRSARAKELYRVAAYLKIPVNRLWQSPNTACPVWDDMEAQLHQLKEQGLLEFIIANNKTIPANGEPERAAKRPRLSEPTSLLSAATKAQIETLMSSATALSRDWDALNLHFLEGEPTIQEARRLLSQVHAFILNLEELPCTISDNGHNGKGNLEEVLRLAYKAAGLDPRLGLARHERNWASQISAFSQFGQSIERAVKDLIVLKPLEDGYRFALPAIVALANSPLVQDQIRIYKEIEALLKE